ncbi:hypothetical protein C4B63_3g1139 [Trypanosoma cruzi]|uniref:Uncharacterized protein n=1 Tax=Trypanosoma cruzi TaxID=5693 RepID=A0A2V2VZE7_TRYCR|nr:hypothetical protein C4B63_3g1139 [Trypanosoma cruzi]
MWPQRCSKGSRAAGHGSSIHPWNCHGGEMRTVRRLASRCLLTPYLLSPWVLSGAPAFYWMIGTAEMWRVFAAPSFGTFSHAVFETVFDCLHCMGCCKTMLYATRLCCGCHAVEIFDVVEVPLEGWGGDPPARVITDGFTRPFEFAVSFLYCYGPTAILQNIFRLLRCSMHSRCFPPRH